MKKGFAPVVVILAVVIVIGALIVMLFMSTSHVGEESMTGNSNQEMMSETMMPSPSPVSTATDTATIEKELNETVTGSFETDINSMQKDASGL